MTPDVIATEYVTYDRATGLVLMKGHGSTLPTPSTGTALLEVADALDVDHKTKYVSARTLVDRPELGLVAGQAAYTVGDIDSIVGIPVGTEIYVNREYHSTVDGSGSFDYQFLDAGTYLIQAKLAPYQDFSKIITVEPDEQMKQAVIDIEIEDRIMRSNWIYLPDANLTPEQLALWVAYRALVRAMKPQRTQWPTKPS